MSREWACVGVDLPSHRRIQDIAEPLQAAAIGVFVCAVLASHRERLDGFCPASAVRHVASQEVLDELVRVQLLARSADNEGRHGFTVRNYLEWNESRATIERKLSNLRKRQRKHRAEGNALLTRRQHALQTRRADAVVTSTPDGDGDGDAAGDVCQAPDLSRTDLKTLDLKPQATCQVALGSNGAAARALRPLPDREREIAIGLAQAIGPFDALDAWQYFQLSDMPQTELGWQRACKRQAQLERRERDREQARGERRERIADETRKPEPIPGDLMALAKGRQR